MKEKIREIFSIRNDIADYDYYTQIFGDLDKLDESENNPEYLVTERLKIKNV